MGTARLYRLTGRGPACIRSGMNIVHHASHNAKGILDWQLRGVERLSSEHVRVFYHPKRPAKSLLIRPGLPDIGVTGFGAVLPLALYLYHYA